MNIHGFLRVTRFVTTISTSRRRCPLRTIRFISMCTIWLSLKLSNLSLHTVYLLLQLVVSQALRNKTFFPPELSSSAVGLTPQPSWVLL